MNHDSEKWLDDRIGEDVSRMAEKRRKELMESEELKDIEATMDELQSIRRRLGLTDAEDGHDMEAAEEFAPEVPIDKNMEPVAAKEPHRPRIRLRVAFAAALVAILALGVGMVGSGKKVYLPVVSQREDGDESTTFVDNNEGNIDSSYDEEEVYQEIEDKLGVLPIRFGYQPKGMELQDYWIRDDQDAVLRFICGNDQFHVYISKDYDKSSINFNVDGVIEETIQIQSIIMDIPVYKYKDSKNNTYFEASFEYLNTYYSITGMLEEEELKKVLENIIIKMHDSVKKGIQSRYIYVGLQKKWKGGCV